MSESSQPSHKRTQAPLTTEEREVLHHALELGYFEVPPKVMLVEIANELGRSDVLNTLTDRIHCDIAMEASRRQLTITDR